MTAKSETFNYQLGPAIVNTLAGSTYGFADGVGKNAKFYYPCGIAVSPSGEMYVGDWGNHKIRKVTANGEVNTLAGSEEGFEDGSAASSKFEYPFGIAVDLSGNVYVADTDNHKIRKIDTAGNVTTIAGSTAGFADGEGANAQFDSPYGIAVDNVGNIYVADVTNHRIRKIAPNGLVSTIAGTGESGYKDGDSSASKFARPYGLAIDNQGKIYVADRDNHKIRIIDTDGKVSTLAGSTQGFADRNGINAQFNYPNSVAIDALGCVYVADSDNHKIRKIMPNGDVSTLAGSIQGFANGEATTAKFSIPRGIAVDSSGNVYVTDSENHKIRIISQE
jgi:sugar lactone lactonase YvrE